MARPLRILQPGGWYHVTARGNNRAALFRDVRDRRRFLALLADLPARFAVEVHAFVLMDNHYHALLRTREANLSHAVRWAHVSYSRWFNWRHRQSGHVFQGRFHAVILEGPDKVAEVARYVHLNPVRVANLGLDKAAVRRQRGAGAIDPGVDIVARRLAVLASYAWSSWQVYCGAQAAPAWLSVGVVAQGCGGRGRAEQRRAVREYTEQPVRDGYWERPWDQLAGGLVLGTEDFARALVRGCKVNVQEQTAARKLRCRAGWERLVSAVERTRGMRWEAMLVRHGDWGRDGAVYYAVRRGGWRLAEVVGRVPGLSYGAAAYPLPR
jgi:REP element-mobilizing transposase RayT